MATFTKAIMKIANIYKTIVILHVQDIYPDLLTEKYIFLGGC